MKPTKLGRGGGPRPYPSRQKPETARLLGSQDCPEGNGRLESEPREQLPSRSGGGGDLDLSYLTGSPPGPSSPRRRKPPPWATVQAPGVSQRAAEREQTDQRWKGKEPKRLLGWRTKGTICPQRRSRGVGSTASCLGSFARISSMPSPAPLCPLPQQSLRPRWVLGLELCVGGRGALSGQPIAWAELPAPLVCVGPGTQRGAPGFPFPLLRGTQSPHHFCSSAGAGALPPSILHCPFPSPVLLPSSDMGRGGVGVDRQPLSLPLLLVEGGKKANEC